MTSDLQMHRSSRLLSSGSGVSQMSQRTFVVVLKRVVHNKRKSPGTSGEVPLHLVRKKVQKKVFQGSLGLEQPADPAEDPSGVDFQQQQQQLQLQQWNTPPCLVLLLLLFFSHIFLGHISPSWPFTPFTPHPTLCRGGGASATCDIPTQQEREDKKRKKSKSAK